MADDQILKIIYCIGIIVISSALYNWGFRKGYDSAIKDNEKYNKKK